MYNCKGVVTLLFIRSNVNFNVFHVLFNFKLTIKFFHFVPKPFRHFLGHSSKSRSISNRKFNVFNALFFYLVLKIK